MTARIRDYMKNIAGRWNGFSLRAFFRREMFIPGSDQYEKPKYYRIIILTETLVRGCIFIAFVSSWFSRFSVFVRCTLFYLTLEASMLIKKAILFFVFNKMPLHLFAKTDSEIMKEQAASDLARKLAYEIKLRSIRKEAQKRQIDERE